MAFHTIRYIINGRGFKTQNKVHAYIESILQKYMSIHTNRTFLTDSENNPEDFLFLVDAYKQFHYVDFGSIHKFEFYRNQFSKDLCMKIYSEYYPEGRTISKRVFYHQKEPSDLTRLKSALRNSIVEFISQYKRSHQCCKQCFHTESIEVDHIKPFSVLVYEFLNYCHEKSILIPKVFTKKDGLDYIDDTIDSQRRFLRHWYIFHNVVHKDNLQSLCKECHLKKTFKKTSV